MDSVHNVKSFYPYPCILTLHFLSVSWQTNAFFLAACDEIQGVEAGNTTASTEGDEQCGLVRSTVLVKAALLLEPFDELLRIKAVSILRRAINGGDFLTYLPDACLLV
jgi:hypothetical protein